MSRRGLLIWIVAAASVTLPGVPAAAAPGAPIWTSTYDGPASGRDTPRGIVVDPTSSRLYVVGTTTAAMNALGTFTDIVTIAYDLETGDRIWTRRYDGRAGGSDLAVAIAFDAASGGVTVTGASDTTIGGGALETVTIAYGPDGSRRWARRVTDPTFTRTLPVELVVIDGSTYVLVDGGDRGRLIAYDAAGARRWGVDVTAGTLAGLTDLVSIGDRLFAVGRVSYDGGSAMFTSAFGTDGGAVWTKRFTGGTSQAVPSDAAAGGTTLYVTGRYGETLSDIATIAYDQQDGTRLWRRVIAPRPTHRLGSPILDVADDGSAIAVAASDRTELVDRFLTRRYLGNGSVDWTVREDDAGESGQPIDVAIGVEGNVYLTGVGTSSGATPGAFTLAYPASGPPSLFAAGVANTDAQDAGLHLATVPLGDRVLVASRVGLDIRIDAYATE